jgi:hypothetical protein
MVQNNLTKKRVAGLSIYLKRAFRCPQNRDSLETNPDAFQHLQLNHP